MFRLFAESLYAYELARALASQPRFTGSDGEARARELVVKELSGFGYDVRLEPFRVRVFEVERAALEVIEPERREVECSGVGFSGETPEEGVEGELVYIEGGDPLLVPSSRGWIGLAATRPDREGWRRLAGRASGLVIAESSPQRGLSRVDVPYEWRERYGSLPAVYVLSLIHI